MLSADNVERIRDAAARDQHGALPRIERRKLADVERKIDRAKANLALAKNAEDYEAVASMLAKWRVQAEKFRGELRNSPSNRPALSADFAVALADLAPYRQRLYEVREPLHAKLKVALRKTVKAITVGNHQRHDGVSGYREWFGAIEFHPELYPDGPVALREELLAADETWRRVASVLKTEPMQTRDVAKLLKMKSQNVLVALHQAARRGRIRVTKSVDYHTGYLWSV